MLNGCSLYFYASPKWIVKVLLLYETKVFFCYLLQILFPLFFFYNFTITKYFYDAKTLPRVLCVCVCVHVDIISRAPFLTEKRNIFGPLKILVFKTKFALSNFLILLCTKFCYKF